MKSPSDKGTTGLVTGCTIVHVAAMPQALVLADSFRHFHPEGKFAILVIDRPDDATDKAGPDVLGLRDLGFPAGEEWRLPMLYEQRNLISALKPALLRALLKQGAGTVACFEYSTLIFGSLSNLELPSGDLSVVASQVIQNGLGDHGRSFVAASSDAEASLHRASDQVRTGAGGRLLGNQNHSPVVELFDIASNAVVKTPGFGISYCNLDPKTFTVSPRGYEIGGQPLRSFDFRGYDPEKPHLLSKYQGLEPRILLSEYGAIAKMCDEYLGKIRRAAQDTSQARRTRPGFLPSGLRLDQRMLRLYQEAIEKWRAEQNPEPPSPFGPEGEEGFVKWLNEPVGQVRQKRVTRYMLEVREDREDVKSAFPDPLGADATGFHDWYLLYGREELDLPDELVPRDPRVYRAGDSIRTADAAAVPINVAGYFRAELGIGVAARSILSALDAASIPFNTISFDATANRQSYPFTDRARENSAADINIVCINPDQLSVFAEQTGPALRHGRYTIGVWFWEVEDFPKQSHGAFNYVDEIWVASAFMRQTFLKVSPKPVFKFQLPVPAPQIDPALSRADLDLPDKFIFLFCFDFFSVLERKNPLGLIEAFTQAFKAGEGPVLIIKTINGEKRTLEMEKLRYAARGRPDIILRDGYLSAVQNSTLTGLADCYVSLHRSEGFGLTIAEAMALGKPVIATAYSGNLEFMTDENSYLCPATRREVGPECEPYPADSHWSEPNLEAATSLMRQVYANQQEARKRGLRAADDIKCFSSAAKAGAIMGDRLTTIRRRRAGPARSIASLEDQIDELEADNARLHASAPIQAPKSTFPGVSAPRFDHD
jgi:glycosyltransferase involved in cell wall biosynthesis